MIRELAKIEVGDAGPAFEAAVNRALPLFETAPGCHGLTLHRSIERAGGYWLIVLWDSLADQEAFRGSDKFDRWRSLVGAHFDGAPQVEHLERVVL